MRKKCEVCGAELPHGIKFCGRCELSKEEMKSVDEVVLRRRSEAKKDEPVEEVADELAEPSVEEIADESVEEPVAEELAEEITDELVESATENVAETVTETPTETSVAAVALPENQQVVKTATDQQVNEVMDKLKGRLGDWFEKVKRLFSENGMKNQNANWEKILAPLAIVIVLILGFIAFSPSEEDKYRAGVAAIGTDIVSLHQDINLCTQTVDLINNEEIAQQLGDDSKLAKIREKYNELKVPKGMGREHRQLSELIDAEEQLRNLVRDICHEPGAKNVEGKVMKVAKLSSAIDIRCSAMAFFKEKVSIDGIDQALKKITVEARKLTVLKEKVIFIKSFDDILQKYTDLQRRPNAIYKLKTLSNVDDVKYFAACRSDVEEEKSTLENLRRDLGKIETTAAEKDFVQKMDTVLRVKIDACSNILALSYKNINDDQRHKAASRAIEYSIAATDVQVEMLQKYEVYRENVKKEVKEVALTVKEEELASQIRSTWNKSL